MLVISLMAGVLVRNNYGVLLLTSASFVTMLIGNVFPNLATYNPLMLSTANVALIEKTTELSMFYPPIVITAVCTVVLIVIIITYFNKKAV